MDNEDYQPSDLPCRHQRRFVSYKTQGEAYCSLCEPTVMVAEAEQGPLAVTNRQTDEIVHELMRAPIWETAANENDVRRRHDAIRAALEAEREACKQIIEAYVRKPRSFVGDAAQETIDREQLLLDIRARSNPKSESTTA